MTETEMTIVTGLVGAAMGVVNALGLWWTVRALPRSRRPAVLTAVSFVLRLALAVVPIVLLADGRPARLVTGLACFVLARIVMIALFGRLAPSRIEGVRP